MIKLFLLPQMKFKVVKYVSDYMFFLVSTLFLIARQHGKKNFRHVAVYSRRFQTGQKTDSFRLFIVFFSSKPDFSFKHIKAVCNLFFSNSDGYHNMFS